MKEGLSSSRSGSPVVIVRSRSEDRKPCWLELQKPVGILVADELSEVRGTINAVERALDRGLYAAGFLSYEASPALDPTLETNSPSDLPLAWWGLFERVTEIDPPPEVAGPLRLPWRPRIARADYYRTVSQIKDLIAAGDTYQVNFTFPLTTPFTARPFDLFSSLVQAQPDCYAAYLDIGRFVICSASPELFLQLDQDRLVVRPMKGTASRGRFPEEDRERSLELRANAKERAENLMIVDMMRNDLGRVAVPGTVRVDDLFRVETHPTVHQLTSTISARSDASLLQILQATFPCSSVTGAPKVRTCQIIRSLESGPRGVYTGAIGFFEPHRRAQLSVGIRTATVDRQLAVATYGTGSGVVWDSSSEIEFEECRTKALVLSAEQPRFTLFETMLWRRSSGFALGERHLHRLHKSADYFGFPMLFEDLEDYFEKLESELAVEGDDSTRRVRIDLTREGQLSHRSDPLPIETSGRWSLALATNPIDSHDRFLFHKTSQREVYDHARRSHPDADDVLLWNECQELTESTIANVVVKLEGDWLTPPVSCGLLAGTFRSELVDTERVQEKVLPIQSLLDAESIFLVNSLRGWIRCRVDRDSITRHLRSADIE